MDLLTFILAAIVCMLSVIACLLAVSMSLKLYTEIMKEKVISSRVKPEHVCAHKQEVRPINQNPPPTFPEPPPPPPPPPPSPNHHFVMGTAVVSQTPIKKGTVPLRAAILIAQKFVHIRKNRRG